MRKLLANCPFCSKYTISTESFATGYFTQQYIVLDEPSNAAAPTKKRSQIVLLFFSSYTSNEEKEIVLSDYQ